MRPIYKLLFITKTKSNFVQPCTFTFIYSRPTYTVINYSSGYSCDNRM